MRKILIATLISLTPLAASGAAYIDPFVSPLVMRTAPKKVTSSGMITAANMFHPSVPSLGSLIIEGVIQSNGIRKLVAKDPDTGKVYLIAPGQAVGRNEKVGKIGKTYFELIRYYRRGRRIIKKVRRIELSLGGS